MQEQKDNQGLLSMVGKGFPDLLVGAKGRNVLIELKDPSKPPSKRKLTDDEQRFFDGWRGQVHKAETIEDILEIIKNIN